MSTVLPAGAASTRVGRNASFRLVSQVLWALVNVGGLALLGNYLQAEGYGRYAFWYALIPLLGALGDLGIGIVVTREMARDPAQGPRLLGDALALKALTSGTLFVAACAVAFGCFDGAVSWLLVLVAAAAVTEIAQDPAIWLFRARERQDVEALLLIVSQAAWIGGLAAGALLRLPLPWLIGAQTAAFLVRVAIGWALVPRLAFRPVFQLDGARLLRLARAGVPYGLAMLGVALHGRIAVLLLQALSTARDVAWFNVAYMLSQPFGFISTALTMSAFPVIARYAAGDPAALREALRKTAKYQILVSLPLMTGLFMLAERVIPLLFHGEDFARAGQALRVTSLAVGFVFLNLMSRYVLAALDRQGAYLRAMVAGLAVNAGIGALLIPRLGYLGGCLAYVAAEAVIFAACQAALARHFGALALLREAARPLLAAAGMALALQALAAAPLALAAAGGAAAYAALLFALRAVTPAERSIVRGVLASFLPRPHAGARAGVRGVQGVTES